MLKEVLYDYINQQNTHTMAGAKETPRQKMIGMMYLVLTCLLALNVSKEVLEGFVTINESIENTNSNFTTNTKLMMDALDDAIKNGRNEVKPYYEKSKEVVKLAQGTYDYVDELKNDIKQYTEDVKGADTMKLSRIEKLDDFDKPTFILIGSDETKPNTGKHSAKELRTNLENYSSTLNKMIDEMKDKPGSKLPEKDYLVLKDKLKLFTPHDNFRDKEGNAVTWEFKNFYNMPLAAVITNLSKIQSDIRSIEAGMVSTFASAPGKMIIPMNQFTARIVPVSQYVTSGTPYTADVFLTATSSHFDEQSVQFVLGDMDTATGKLSEGAIVLPVESGNGKITIPTAAAGHKEIKGWIKMKDGNGLYKYFRYNDEYVVANSALAVSADKMNVMYIGVDNPVSVSAAGIAPTDLIVNISGCGGSIANSGNGKYNAKVTSTGTCMVSVSAKTANGVKSQGPPQVFRVKRIPNPPLKVAGTPTFGNLDLKQNIARTVNGVGLDASGFDYQTTCKVSEFTMSIIAGGVAGQEFKCYNGQLSPEAKAAISKVKTGNKIFFENIKIVVAGETRDAGLIKIVVK